MDQFLQTAYHLVPLFTENKTVPRTSCKNVVNSCDIATTGIN